MTMTDPAPHAMGPTGAGRAARRLRRGGLVVSAVAAALSFSVPMAAAGAPAMSHFKPTKVMVKIKFVNGFGTILESKKGLALYVDTTPPCTGSCLALWPPLLMPPKKTVPLGAANLGTTPFGTSLQVTYKGMPVYTFYADTRRHPPMGDNFQNFVLTMYP